MAGPIASKLPRGGTLPDDAWQLRHRGVIVLLWLHAVAIPLYALIRGFDLQHVVLESAIVPITALVAARPELTRRVRTLAASFGLLSCSAVLVHLSGGLIEMHFHFFVMVAVVSLYQDWLPFLAAIAYVVVHHGFLGALDPGSVFNHPAAINHPWRWAGVHAFFVAGISGACLVNWRLNERHLNDAEVAGQRLREESHVVERLNEVGRMLAADLELDHVVQRVTDVATELTDAEFGAFFYNAVDEFGATYLLYSLSGASRDDFADFPLPRATALFGPTFRGEDVICVDDVLQDPRYGLSAPHHGMPPGHLPVRSYLAVPVSSRGEILGGLFFGHAEPARFGEAQVRAAQGIAAHAAVAVQNARLYADQRAAAETLQHSLLPARLPSVPGFDLAARYVPGGTGSEVGGDWYDAFPLPGGGLAFVMGDVVGRGITAASLMGQLRNGLRAYALEGHSPSAVLERLNGLACEIGQGYVATVVVAVLDPVSGTLRMANAGHPPPLVAGPVGASYYADTTSGLPLGVLERAPYGEAVVPFCPGSTLLLYTDGLVESPGVSLDDGLERLRRAAAEGPEEIERFASHVLDEVPAGPSRRDDTALLVVRRRAVRPGVAFDVPTDPSSLAWVRSALRTVLDGAGLTEDERFDVLVAAGEVCSKAMRRADDDRTISVQADVAEDVTLTVTFPPGMPAPDGMDLAVGLMDEVTVGEGPGATVSLRRRIGARGALLSP